MPRPLEFGPVQTAYRRISSAVGPSVRRAGRLRRLSVEAQSFRSRCGLAKDAIDGKTILINVERRVRRHDSVCSLCPMVAARWRAGDCGRCRALRARCYRQLSGARNASPSRPMSCRRSITIARCSSLPLAFGTRLETIPAAIPYLPAPAECRLQAWEDRLGPRERLRVGLVWSGNPRHDNDHNRSIPLRLLTRYPGCRCDFCQSAEGPRDLTTRQPSANANEIVDLTAHLTDFAETAALVSCLDLVISVDTSVVHLAGALGRPTWIILPYRPDWRWLLGRDDSPWYPTVRLFRQSETREYGSVLDRVRTELLATISASKAR